MRSFEEAAALFERTLRAFSFKKENKKSVVEYETEILGEKVNILFMKTSLTGSERPKPQIRVFTEKIIEKASGSLANNERFFCFIHCSHSEEQLKFQNLKPHEYIVSLESDWNYAAGRIDIRSIYDFIEQNLPVNFLKVNKTQHSTPSILQAAVFQCTEHGIENLEPYLKFFDSRLITKQDAPNDFKAEDNEAAQAVLLTKGINKIYFGAPGTGKSYSIQKFIRENGIENYDEKQGHPNVFRTTLHSEFSYYDFVGQIMPVVLPKEGKESESKIEYSFVPKIFTKALQRAFSEGVKDRQPVFLILEEMSRANVAAVFGDLFQLLDRDSDTGESEYKINNDLIAQYVFNNHEQIYIPSNLFIIGTVNTNDQNVFVMDTAFKRRFEFEYVNANAVVIKDGKPINNYQFELVEDGEKLNFNWITFYRALNQFITKKVEHGGLGLKEDKQLGQFFIKFRDQDDVYNFNQIKGKLLQYLYEDVEEVSYTGISIFKKDINSFGDAYVKLSERKNIFSKELLHEYHLLESSE